MASPSKTDGDYKLQFFAIPKASSGKFSNSDLIGIFVLICLGLSVINSLGLVVLTASFSKLSKKPPATVVQMASGEAFVGTSLDNKERTPQVVKTFVEDSLSSLLTWSGSLPDEEGKEIPDPGVEVEAKSLKTGSKKKRKITTPAYQAGFTLSEDFRKEFLGEIGNLTPTGVFDRTTQVAFVPLDVSAPIKIEDGKWKVTVVANLFVTEQRNLLGEAIPFNKEVFIRAVETLEYKIEANGIASVIQNVRSSGLEIYAITDLTKEEIK